MLSRLAETKRCSTSFARVTWGSRAIHKACTVQQCWSKGELLRRAVAQENRSVELVDLSWACSKAPVALISSLGDRPKTWVSEQAANQPEKTRNRPRNTALGVAAEPDTAQVAAVAQHSPFQRKNLRSGLL